MSDQASAIGRMAARHLGSLGTVVDDATFGVIGKLEVRKAVRLQYYVSLLAIKPSLNDYGNVVDPRGLVRRLAPILDRQLRATDLVGIASGVPSLYVLLIDAYLEGLPVVIERLTEEVKTHRFDIEGKRQSVRLTIGYACFPTTATSWAELMNQATARLRRATNDDCS
jgi:diguanylate cyclase (GGDEF)-like protein